MDVARDVASTSDTTVDRTSPVDAPAEVAPRADVSDVGVVPDAPADVSVDVVDAPVCRPPLGMCAGATDCCSMDCTGGRCACVPWQGPCTFNDACCSGRCNIPTSTCLCGDIGALCNDDPDCCGRLTCAGGTCSP
jgi:hypothetical protein